ncbi:MAG TPA: hypothetical protein VG318_11305 [Actinomycetota bacterium]|nr:hypothetical protein [Actinomycetota bacterium]
MADDRPLDLTALGDVAAPDLVSGALRRFRRRVFTTGALVAVSALGLAGGIAWATVFNRTLAEQVDAAPGADVGVVLSDERAVTLLERVARTDDGLALHLHLATPGAGRGSNYFYSFDGARNFYDEGSQRVHDFYYVVAPPLDGVVDGELRLQTGCDSPRFERSCEVESEKVHSFTIDLEQLRVPAAIWKE